MPLVTPNQNPTTKTEEWMNKLVGKTVNETATNETVRTNRGNASATAAAANLHRTFARLNSPRRRASFPPVPLSPRTSGRTVSTCTSKRTAS